MKPSKSFIIIKTEKFVPIEILNDLFYCEGDSLYWKINRSNIIKKGQKAGCPIRSGYIDISFIYNGKRIRHYAHRIVFAINNNRWPCGIIDHIDRNVSNNNIKNLREVTVTENGVNSKEVRKNSSTGIKNISKHKDGYQVEISRYGKRYRKFFSAIKDAIDHKNLMLTIINKNANILNTQEHT